MKHRFPILFSSFLLFTLLACSKDTSTPNTGGIPDPPAGTTEIPATTQKSGGDAEAGYDYLRYGDFIGGGIPLETYTAIPGSADNANLLQRTGPGANLPPSFNAFTALSGVEVAGGLTCFGCHAASVNGQFYPGLGNSEIDFTQSNEALFEFAAFAIRQQYGEDSPEWEAFLPYYRGGQKAAPYMVTPFKGVNPAFLLEQASVAHKDPLSLNFSETPLFPIMGDAPASDTPPLWNVRKKNALYYTGLGRGDFTKLLMQVAVVAVEDTAQARAINDNFLDVLAWLQQLDAPEYPYALNSDLLAKGETVFNNNCANCHGTYGTEETYPNLLVEVSVVGSDPLYAEFFQSNQGFTNWYNSSWYAQGAYFSQHLPETGYIAPPLDGIWATAPYLHNGSVPTLADLLNSTQRPTYWRRSFDNTDYNTEKVGWNYTLETSATDENTYNTSLKGYSNSGHTFGDQLSTEDKTALLEYLKSL